MQKQLQPSYNKSSLVLTQGQSPIISRQVVASAQQFKNFCGRCQHTIGDGSVTSTSSFDQSEIKDNGVEHRVLFFIPTASLH